MGFFDCSGIYRIGGMGASAPIISALQRSCEGYRTVIGKRNRLLQEADGKGNN